MTEAEKILELKNLLGEDTPGDDELSTLLLISKGAILNARYPMGDWGETEVPKKYEHIQLQACVAMFNKKGAEGQTSHSENGIGRTYEQGDIPISLLKQIVPIARSVITNEKSS